MKLTNTVKIISLVILIILVAVLFPKISDQYAVAESKLESAGSLGPLFYMLLMIAAILVAPIPASPLAIIAGSVFGALPGMIYTLISATIGAVLAFLIARFFIRDSLKNQLENSNFYKKFKGKGNKNIIYIIFVTRLMPQVSFDLVSYAAGLTGVRVLPFAIVTFLGMIPMVFLLSFFGYLIQPYMFWFLVFLTFLFVAYLVYKIFTYKGNNKQQTL